MNAYRPCVTQCGSGTRRADGLCRPCAAEQRRIEARIHEDDIYALPPGRWVLRGGIKYRVNDAPDETDEATERPKPTRRLSPCGTPGAYRRHLKAGEEPCAPCRRAARDDARQRRRDSRKAAARATWAEPVNDEASATVARLVVAVAVATGADASRIYSRRMDAPTADARHMVAYLARLEGLSWPQIGRALHRDHSTALYGARRVREDARLRQLAHAARDQITERSAA